MNLLHDAYTALLSGLTYKTGNEIHWNDENGNLITVEPIDIKKCRYIVRYYYPNRQVEHKIEYQNDKRHGKGVGRYKNGEKSFEYEYQSGKPHGKYIGWYENGNKEYEYEYQNGRLYGKYIWWSKNGKKENEYEY
jgi:antitoxin component YwqK of YwqJK toxin-antitoxin module